ncbi:unnamed protein product [Amoebophrya sp. A25]|nr:unnamed protein product [Amoebophrya sp. A25]|eukprot:GSA25T00013885001.1
MRKQYHVFLFLHKMELDAERAFSYVIQQQLTTPRIQIAFIRNYRYAKKKTFLLTCYLYFHLRSSTTSFESYNKLVVHILHHAVYIFSTIQILDESSVNPLISKIYS